VEPKQSPQLLLNQCPVSVCVHEQSPLKVGSPALSSKKRERVPVVMNKKDALLPKKLCGINVVSKSKKDSLPHTSVTPLLIVRFKLARNTNKKTKATNLIINKKKDKPFETVFARMEKRRMLSKNKTIDSPVNEDEVCQVEDDNVASGVDEVKIGDDNDNDVKDNEVYDDDNEDRNDDEDGLCHDNEDRNNDKDKDENKVENKVADEDDEDDGDYEDDDDVKENNYNNNNDVMENEVANDDDNDNDNNVKENVVDVEKMNTTMAMIPCWQWTNCRLIFLCCNIVIANYR